MHMTCRTGFTPVLIPICHSNQAMLELGWLTRPGAMSLPPFPLLTPSLASE